MTGISNHKQDWFAQFYGWGRVISHNPIMPAIINHFLVVQLHLRFFINFYLEYLSTFWNLCAIIGLSLKNGHFFIERKSPDIPENISDHKRNSETTDSAFLDQEQPKKWAKTKKDTRTPITKNIYTGKNQNPTLVPAPEM
jgi:hypothetical protein